MMIRNKYLNKDISSCINILGLFQDITEGREVYWKKFENFVSKCNSIDCFRVFMPYPPRKKWSELPKYKRSGVYAVTEDGGFDEDFWGEKGNFNIFCEIMKQYDKKVIFVLSGFSRVVKNYRSFYRKSDVDGWMRDLRYLLTKIKANFNGKFNLRKWKKKFFIEPINEIWTVMSGTNFTDKIKMGNFHADCRDVMVKEFGLSIHNMCLNLNIDEKNKLTTWDQVGGQVMGYMDRNGKWIKGTTKKWRYFIASFHGFSGVKSMTENNSHGLAVTGFPVSHINATYGFNSDGYKYLDKKVGTYGLWRTALRNAIIETWEYNIKRWGKVLFRQLLFSIHVRGDGKERMYRLLDGYRNEAWIYLVFNFCFEDYVLPYIRAWEECTGKKAPEGWFDFTNLEVVDDIFNPEPPKLEPPEPPKPIPPTPPNIEEEIIMEDKKLLQRVIDGIKKFFGKYWSWGIKFIVSILAIWKLLEIIF